MYIPELAYPPEEDEHVFREAQLQLGIISMHVEAVTMAGSAAKKNQDAFGFNIGPNRFLAGVFDGAVSRIASHEAKKLFEGHPEAIPAYQMLSHVNAGLANVELNGGASTGTLIEVALDDETPEEISDEASAWWFDIAHVSDSWAMLLMRDKNTRLLTRDQHEHHDRKVLKKMARIAVEEGISLAEARHDPRVVQALTDMFTLRRNAPDRRGGEGILNGSRHMDQYIQTLLKRINIADVERILIGTDGARFPRKHERDSRYRRNFFTIVKNHGVETVLDQIRRSEELRPPTPEHPRWSVHDDKTLIDIALDI